MQDQITGARDNLDSKTLQFLTSLIKKICEKNKIALTDEKINLLLDHMAAQIKEGKLEINPRTSKEDLLPFIMRLTAAATLVNGLEKILDPKLDKELIKKLQKILEMKGDKKFTLEELKEKFTPTEWMRLESAAKSMLQEINQNLPKPTPTPGAKLDNDRVDPLAFLLGMINCHQTGTLQVAMAVFLGDFLGIPDVNPYEGFDNLGIKNRYDDTQVAGDPLGLNALSEERLDDLAGGIADRVHAEFSGLAPKH